MVMCEEAVPMASRCGGWQLLSGTVVALMLAGCGSIARGGSPHATTHSTAPSNVPHALAHVWIARNATAGIMAVSAYEGDVWIVLNGPRLNTRGLLAEYNGETGKKLAAYQTVEYPASVAADSDGVWVAGSVGDGSNSTGFGEHLVQFFPRARQAPTDFTATNVEDFALHGVVADGYVDQGYSAVVLRMNGITGHATRIKLPGQPVTAVPHEVMFCGGATYAVTLSAANDGQIILVGASSARRVSVLPVSGQPMLACLDGSTLVAAVENAGATSIFERPLVSEVAQVTIPVGGDLAAGNDLEVVGDDGAGPQTIYVVHGAHATAAGTTSVLPYASEEMTAEADHLWLVAADNQTTTRDAARLSEWTVRRTPSGHAASP